ncbi:hypothetical protein [Rhodopseudomonas sp. RCAM05734]|uniref:hypothetical protein n=1 Tax=Rhodopseudomonas sp. RCAM05734 TaxID=3457549 RepID=UPI004044CBA2
MSYEDIRISGDLAEALEAWVVQRYGKVVDIEVGGVNEGEYAAVAYAAVEDAQAGEGTVEGVVLLLKHDPEGGSDSYLINDMGENEGPVVDFCPIRILDQLSPTEDQLAIHWRDRCREQALRQSGRSAFSLNS